MKNRFNLNFKVYEHCVEVWKYLFHFQRLRLMGWVDRNCLAQKLIQELHHRLQKHQIKQGKEMIRILIFHFILLRRPKLTILLWQVPKEEIWQVLENMSDYRGNCQSWGEPARQILFCCKGNLRYRKVASSITSCLEAHAGFFRLLMKGIFDTVTFWFDFLFSNVRYYLRQHAHLCWLAQTCRFEKLKVRETELHVITVFFFFY